MTTRIYLTGFMTSGKSTLGPILANVLGWEFYDLDKVIERDQNKSINDIFTENGEGFFRKIERQTLIKLCSLNKVIVGLGGGTIADAENFKFMKESGKIIYLYISPETIYKRIKNKIDRPLFRELVLAENSKDEFLKRINDLMKDRSKYYEDADLIINTEENPIGITIDKIVKKIKVLINEKN